VALERQPQALPDEEPKVEAKPDAAASTPAAGTGPAELLKH